MHLKPHLFIQVMFFPKFHPDPCNIKWHLPKCAFGSGLDISHYEEWWLAITWSLMQMQEDIFLTYNMKVKVLLSHSPTFSSCIQQNLLSTVTVAFIWYFPLEYMLKKCPNLPLMPPTTVQIINQTPEVSVLGVRRWSTCCTTGIRDLWKF